MRIAQVDATVLGVASDQLAAVSEALETAAAGVGRLAEMLSASECPEGIRFATVFAEFADQLGKLEVGSVALMRDWLMKYRPEVLEVSRTTKETSSRC